MQAIDKRSVQDIKSIEHIKNEKQALKYFTDKKNKRINRLI